MNGFMPLLKKEIKEQLRTYRLLIMASVFLLFGLSIPLTYKYMPEILKLSKEVIPADLLPTFTAAQTLTGYAGNIGQIGVFVAVLVLMGSIANELKNGTGVITLSKPVSYSAFVNTKFVAMTLTTLFSLAIASVFCFAYTVWLIGDAAVLPFVGMNLMLGLFLLFCIALTLFCSSLFKNSVAAGGLSIGIIIGQGLFSAIPVYGDYMPGKLLQWGTNLLEGQGEVYWWALGITIGLTVVWLYLAQLRLKRTEL